MHVCALPSKCVEQVRMFVRDCKRVHISKLEDYQTTNKALPLNDIGSKNMLERLSS